MARYQKIHSHIWQDEKFITLSHDAKYLFLYVLTSPHSNSIGLYVLPKQYICADLNWDMKRLAKPFAELLSKGLIYYDETVKLICIKNHLKHNPIENENQAKSIAKIIKSLPKSSLYSITSEQLSKRFHEPLRQQLRIQYAKPEEQEQEQEQKEEEKTFVPPRETGSGLPASSAFFIVVPLTANKTFPVTNEMVAELKNLYPGIDVEQELRNIRGWNLANVEKRKTESGIKRHIHAWMAREQNKSNGGLSW